MAELQFHPVASIFPLMEGYEFDTLVLDIKTNGLREPIWTHDGQIIDGRNRYRACKQAKVKPTYREWDGDGSLVAFVFSLNLHRRHLDVSQRSMVALKLTPHLEDEAKARMEAGKKTDPTANLRQGTAAAQAAEIVGVSERSVESAKHVAEHAAPEVVAAVEQGEVSVSDAAKVADEPKPKQRRALRSLKSGKSKTLKAAVDKIKAADKEVEEATTEEMTAADKCEADNKAIESFCRALVKFFEDNAPQTAWTDVDGRIPSALASVRAGCNTLRTAKAVVCPQCDGEGCQYCNDVGYLPKFKADQVARVS